jgi:hypothetical protein
VTRRDLVLALRTVGPATIALGIVIGVLPGRAELVIRIYALVVGAVAIAIALRVLQRAYPPATSLPTPAAPERERRRVPETLAVIEREAAIGVLSAFELHQRLRPRLRLIAAGLLDTRRRMALDDDPEASRAALGNTTWELVRPDRRPPQDRLASGLPVESLRIVVKSLENV